ncbi:hypothetical protein GNP67_06205 [Aliivibrio fischeri]|nr:hypothetical protein [Aliivibrio fischeri]
MKYNKVFYWMLFALISSNTYAQDENYQFTYQCIDSNIGNENKQDWPSQDDDDDGYDGIVNLSIENNEISIVHNDLFITRKEISNNHVSISSSGRFKVLVSEGRYYSFSLDKNASIYFVNLENLGNEGRGLICKKGVSENKAHEVEDYIRSKLDEVPVGLSVKS